MSNCHHGVSSIRGLGLGPSFHWEMHGKALLCFHPWLFLSWNSELKKSFSYQLCGNHGYSFSGTKWRILILSCYLLAFKIMGWIAGIFQANGLSCSEDWLQTPGLKHTWHAAVITLWDAGVTAPWSEGTAPNWLPSPCQARLQWVFSCFTWHSVPPWILPVLALKSTIFPSDFWFLLSRIVCTWGSLKSHWDGHLRALSE